MTAGGADEALDVERTGVDTISCLLSVCLLAIWHFLYFLLWEFFLALVVKIIDTHKRLGGTLARDVRRGI
jgi:hypothetical protein